MGKGKKWDANVTVPVGFHAAPRRHGHAQLLLDDRRPLPRLGVLPGLNESKAFLDGMVVDWESTYKTSKKYEDRYDLGFTAVHEVGHWLALADTSAPAGCRG